MKRVLLVLSPGFEELEAVAPLDLLRRAGIEVVSAAAQPDLAVAGSHDITVRADRLLEDCAAERFDLLLLPGGPGVDGMRKDARVLELVRRYRREGLPIAAICAAPLVLADAGVAGDRAVTSFPGVRAELEGRVGSYSEERVVIDKGLITSRGAGTAEEFALTLVEYLAGSETAERVRRQVVARS